MNTTGSTFKVLVIDDSNTIRRSAEIFLKQGGHEVMLAEDGFDALAKVNDYQPHLIFCDILIGDISPYYSMIFFLFIDITTDYYHPIIILSDQ